jgi:hypothetical protein
MVKFIISKSLNNLSSNILGYDPPLGRIGKMSVLAGKESEQ